MPATVTLRAFFSPARHGRSVVEGDQDAAVGEAQTEQGQPEEPQEQKALQVEQASDYRELFDRWEARIAELEAQAQAAEAAKSQDAADKLTAEIEQVRSEASEEKVAYELRFAGAKNVTAAKALLRRARQRRKQAQLGGAVAAGAQVPRRVRQGRPARGRRQGRGRVAHRARRGGAAGAGEAAGVRRQALAAKRGRACTGGYRGTLRGRRGPQEGAREPVRRDAAPGEPAAPVGASGVISGGPPVAVALARTRADCPRHRSARVWQRHGSGLAK